MAYSRAYETYAQRDSMMFTTDPARKGGNMIFYNNMPLPVRSNGAENSSRTPCRTTAQVMRPAHLFKIPFSL